MALKVRRTFGRCYRISLCGVLRTGDFMPKIIIVSGPGNTGKTSSIKQAMNALGVYVSTPRQSTDILLSAHLHLNGSGYNVGFASGGDTAPIVQANINFFSNLNLDHMVFACRSRGAGLALLTTYAQSLGVQPIIIRTARSQNPTAAIAQTVQAIVSNIP